MMMTVVTTDVEDIENIVLPPVMRDIRIVDTFVSKNKQKVNTKDKGGRTLLQYAAEDGNVETMMLLLENNARTDICDYIHQSPLHWSARNHQPRTTKVLLEYKADVECNTQKHRTPLQFAAMCGKDARESSKEVSQSLLDFNASPLASDELKRCAYDRAWDFENEPIVQLFEAEEEHWHKIKHEKNPIDGLKKAYKQKRTDHNDDYEGLLRIASYCGDERVVKKCIKKKVLSINSQDKNGWSALHYAAQKGHISIVKILLMSNAKIDITIAQYMRTPLHIAVLHHQTEVVSLLLEWKADCNIEDCFGHTAVYYAEKSNFRDISELMEVQQPQEESRGSVGEAEKGSPSTSGAIEDTPKLGAATSVVSTTEGVEGAEKGSLSTIEDTGAATSAVSTTEGGSVGGAEKGSPSTSGAIEDTPKLGAATSVVSTTEGGSVEGAEKGSLSTGGAIEDTPKLGAATSAVSSTEGGSVEGAEKGSPSTAGAIEDTPKLGAATSAVSTTEGDPKFKDWGRSIHTHEPIKKDHLKLQHFMSAVEVILLVHDAFTKRAVLEDLKPPLEDFKDPVSFPTRETFLGMFQGKKTALLFSGMSESLRSINKAVEHYFPQATTVVTLSVGSNTKISNGMSGDIVTPKNTRRHLVWNFECDTNARKSVIHPIDTDIDMPAKRGITTSSICGISTKKAWIVTAAKAAVDYCKVFIQDDQQSIAVSQMNPLAYVSSINMESDIPTSSSLYYLLSLLSDDFRKVFLDIVSKARWLEASPVDTEGDCSDALACITRVVSWTQCSTERSWSALISLMKANNLTTAAIEIEKCLEMIVRFTTLSEAAFLLSDEDHKKAMTDSETLRANMIELGIRDFNKISVTINQENENENHFYYPQYMISVGVADIAKYERSVYKAAINIATPVIVKKDEVFVSFCGPGSEVRCGGGYGTLGCCKINGTSDTYTFSTCHHVIHNLNGIQVSCNNGNIIIPVTYHAGIRNSKADICLLKTECADVKMDNMVTDNNTHDVVELQNFGTQKDGIPVFKRGARTSYTDMVVQEKCTSLTVDYDGIEVEVRDVWLLQHANPGDCPAAKGDSGSLVAIPEIDNNIVGILFAGNTDTAAMFDFGLNLHELQSSYV